MSTWQLQEAKARLSELVKRAQVEGPQDITVHGRSVAVVMSRGDFDQLLPQQSLVVFMQSSPLVGLDELQFERNNSLGREVSL